jgi:hypothetical protein
VRDEVVVILRPYAEQPDGGEGQFAVEPAVASAEAAVGERVFQAFGKPAVERQQPRPEQLQEDALLVRRDAHHE